MDALLEKLVEENRPFTREGRVAGYIPELAKADRDELGICVVSSDGRISSAGEYRRTFTIQSIIKPILLLLALMDNGEDTVRARVGVEATGKPFDAINYTDQALLSEHLNPMVNMGAILLCTLIHGTSYSQRLERLLDTCRRGQVLKSGVRTAIVGRPNAGKSSLLNALAGYERAIVTDIPGTTRDTVEESVLCGGVLLRLIDTAGIRATEDPVEQLGVERSRRAIASAELVLAVVDGAVPEDSEEGSLLADVARCGVPWLLVFTKRDMAGGLRTAGAVFPAGEGPLAPPAAVVSLSSVTGEGLEDLGNAVAALFPAGDPGEAGSLLTDRRQEDAARRALDAVRRALEALETGMTPDAVLTDAEEALDALGELTGRTAKEEIVSRIFSRFCVGK